MNYTNISLFANGKSRWLAFIALATLLAMMNIGVVVSEDLAEQNEVRIFYYIVNEFSGVYLAFALLPFLFWFFRAYPLQAENWWRRLPAYVLASVLFGIAHTLLMYGTRAFLYPRLGLGSYAKFYGLLEYRFLMEYFKQLLFFLAALGVWELFQKWKENQEQRWRASQLERQLVQARLQALQMQLNPHFLFNTLNLISSVMYESPKRADKMIDNLSRLLRLALNGQGMETHALGEEMEWLELYLEIMQARFEDKLSVQLDIAEDARRASVPVFILRPIVENAIKFSVGQLGRAAVAVRGRVLGDNLEMAVQDNGPGLSAAAGKYVEVHTQEKTFLIRATLQELEEQLDPEHFARIHRSHILNLNHLREMHPRSHGDYTAVLDNGEQLIISRRYKDGLF